MTSPTKASVLQMFPWPTCVEAVKQSVDYPDFASFYAALPDTLRQNSAETRRRTANLIAKWYFPSDDLNGIPTLAWRHYRDEQLLVDLMRMMTLEAEPVIADFVTEHLQLLEPGTLVTKAMTSDYVAGVYGGFSPKSHGRLTGTCRHLGFLERNGGEWRVASVSPPANALLVVLHHRLAPSPRIVRLSDLLASPFWRYLGLSEASEVRAILHEAAAAGLIARYVTVDQLEQITTRYTLDQYLSEAKRL